MFGTVIKELQTMPNTESAVQNLQSKILDFENQYKPCKTVQRQRFMITIYSEIIQHYPLKLEESENDDVKLIVKLLKNFNAYNAKGLFQPEMSDYVKVFEEKFQELKEVIKRENEVFSNELNKWFVEVYNAQNDLFDKYRHIANLPYQPFFEANTRNNFNSLQ